MEFFPWPLLTSVPDGIARRSAPVILSDTSGLEAGNVVFCRRPLLVLGVGESERGNPLCRLPSSDPFPKCTEKRED